MKESREPDDRDAKRRKTQDAQEEKQQEKVGEKPKEVSEEGTQMDSTPPQNENPESELREVEVKTESEEVNSTIGKQEIEVVVVTADGSTSAEKTVSQQEEEELQRAIELSKESFMLASMGLNPNAPGSTSSPLPPIEEELQRAIELSKESFILASMGLNPNAPGSTSSALPPVEEELQRAIELSKETFMLASMGLNPNAPGSTSGALPATEFEFEVELSSSRSSSFEEVASNSEELPPEEPEPEPEGLKLFEMKVPRSNLLVIRGGEAAKFLPTLPAYCESNIERELKILDCNKQEWTMTLLNYIEENVYLISKGWYEYTGRHNIYATDVIAFYTPLDLAHYNIHFVRLGDNQINPGYPMGDLLFEHELQWADIVDSRLSLPTADVENHFPAVKMVPGTGLTKQIVRFTDVHSIDWYMEITLHNDTDYMITYGWEHFVREHELEAMDRIMFYMPSKQLHAKHFMIDYVRKKDGGSNLNTQPPGGERSCGSNLKTQPPGGERSEQGERSGGSNLNTQPPGGERSEHENPGESERSEQENPGRLSRQAKGKQKVFDF